MGFKKHDWLNYNREGYIAELKILEDDGHKVDFFKWNTVDKKSEQQVLYILRRKYGLNFRAEIPPNKSINELKKKEKETFKEDKKW